MQETSVAPDGSVDIAVTECGDPELEWRRQPPLLYLRSSAQAITPAKVPFSGQPSQRSASHADAPQRKEGPADRENITRSR